MNSDRSASPVNDLIDHCHKHGLGWWMGYDPHKHTPEFKYEVRLWDSADLRIRRTGATVADACREALGEIRGLARSAR